jgi:hypothetical protein
LWDGVSLTFAGIVLGIIAAVAGVFVANAVWWIRVIYAGGVVVLAYLGLFRYRARVMQWVQGFVARS